MNHLLLLAAGLDAAAAFLHIGCIVFGAPWYRFFGAGEQMAVMAERGSLRPALITSGIVVVLLTWSTYSASAAGLVLQLPLLKPALVAITTTYFIRGVVGFFFVASPVMGNSSVFWFWSSLICSGFGFIHLAGLLQIWNTI